MGRFRNALLREQTFEDPDMAVYPQWKSVGTDDDLNCGIIFNRQDNSMEIHANTFKIMANKTQIHTDELNLPYPNRILFGGIYKFNKFGTMIASTSVTPARTFITVLEEMVTGILKGLKN